MLKLIEFKVTNFRNVIDSGWIRVGTITALIGPNESGKSNLCEALYRLWPFDEQSSYDLDFDWPLDKWEEKDPETVVCSARFAIQDESGFLNAIGLPPKPASAEDSGQSSEDVQATINPRPGPSKLNHKEPMRVVVERDYDGEYSFTFENLSGEFDKQKAEDWVENEIPHFVYIHEYDISGQQIELPHLAQRLKDVKWDEFKSRRADYKNNTRSSEGRYIRFSEESRNTRRSHSTFF